MAAEMLICADVPTPSQMNIRNIFKTSKRVPIPFLQKKSFSWKFSEQLEEICVVSDIIKLMYLA